MKIFTTKVASELLYSDEFRNSGCPDVFCIENISRTIEVQTSNDEIEEFSLDRCIEIDADMMADHIVDDLVDFLNQKRYLDSPIKDLK